MESTCKCFIPIVFASLNSFIGQTKLISSKYCTTKKNIIKKSIIILKKVNLIEIIYENGWENKINEKRNQALMDQARTFSFFRRRQNAHIFYWAGDRWPVVASDMSPTRLLPMIRSPIW